MAVTKYVDSEIARELITAGCKDLGESRPQELWTKATALQDLRNRVSLQWHLIGHLQRNKVRQTLPLVSLVHSGDSLRILESINEAAEHMAAQRPVPLLLEVNISQEPNKQGFSVTAIERELPAIANLHAIEVRGLMCMASRQGDLAQARREFAALRELRNRLMQAAPPQVKLVELSMGMSGDFEAAIAEGATIVRVGSALFKGVSTH